MTTRRPRRAPAPAPIWMHPKGRHTEMTVRADRVEVLIRRLDPGLPLPECAHPGDAGVDLYAASDVDLAPGERAVVPNRIAITLPDRYAAVVHPRSRPAG